MMFLQCHLLPCFLIRVLERWLFMVWWYMEHDDTRYFYPIGTNRCRHLGLFWKDIRTCNNAHCAASVLIQLILQHSFIYGYRHFGLFWKDIRTCNNAHCAAVLLPIQLILQHSFIRYCFVVDYSYYLMWPRIVYVS